MAATDPSRGHQADADAVRVLLCDDHALFRRALLTVLEAEEGVEVVAEAANGHEAITLAEALAPDVVLLDVRLAVIASVQVAAAVSRAAPAARIVMLTVGGEDDEVFAALCAGAVGSLHKETSIDEVVGAIDAVTTGESLLTASVASRVLDAYDAWDGPGGELHPGLTDRERTVLAMTADGKTNPEVVAALDMPIGTVRNHARNALAKLQHRARCTDQAGS